MSRKDYEAIAAIIQKNKTHEFPAERISWEIGAYFEQTNSRFDFIRFLRACGMIELSERKKREKSTAA